MAEITSTDLIKASIGANFLQSYLPKDLLDLLGESEAKSADNYARSIIQNALKPKTSSFTQGNVFSGGGGDGTGGLSVGGVGGLGSVTDLANNPSRDNLRGLQDFAALNDTMLGRAFLDALGAMVDFAINPAPGPIGKMQDIAGFMERNLAGTNKIAESLAGLKSIPKMDAIAANRAALSIQNNFSKLSEQQIDNISVISEINAIANATGYDPRSDPNVTAVGRTSMGVAGYQVGGKFGATYGWNPDFGWEVVADAFKGLTKEEQEEAEKERDRIANDANKARGYDPAYSPDQIEAAGGGRTGPETFLSKEGKPTAPPGSTPPPAPAPSPGFNFPDDAGYTGVPDETMSIANAMTENFGIDDTPDDVYDNNPNTDVFSEVDSFSEVGGNVDTTSQVDSFSDIGGGDDGGADGGNTGGDEGDSSGAGNTDGADSGGEWNKGGFVKKRKYKKKKTRRGLASR